MLVPDVVGLRALSARQLGHENGLVVLGSDPDGPPTNTGLVVRQEPEPGSRVVGSAGDREPRMPRPPGELRSLASQVE